MTLPPLPRGVVAKGLRVLLAIGVAAAQFALKMRADRDNVT